ncbi:MAG: glycosyltransferase family 4 protein [Thermodesulfobacteriota bacterium]
MALRRLSKPNPGKPIRLAILLQDLKFGGTQRQALELARGLDPERYRIELWTLMGGLDLLPAAESQGIPVVRLGRGAYVWPPDLFRLWMRLRTHALDILFLMTGIPNIWGRLLGRITGVPLIVGACRDHILWHERFLGRLAHHHVCNSIAVKEFAMERYRVPEEHMTVIPNGVDLERFSPAGADGSPQNPVLLHIGRLVKDKDQAALIEAFGLIAREFPGAELWIVGDGLLEGKLRRLAAGSPYGDRIRLIPGLGNIAEVYRKARVFVLSSVRESLPNAVLEAMACGLPVVATDVGGLREVVEPERTGLLVPPASPHDLADALRRLLADPEEAMAFGREGRRKVEDEFSLPRMVERYDVLFQDLLAMPTVS